MKKILILTLSIFLLTACYDYQELNDRAIIVGLAVDMENNEYIVNFEVLNSQKNSSEQQGKTSTSYLAEGKDQNFAMAYQKALFSLNKDAYLAHLKALIISEEVAKTKLKNLIDYLIRDPNTRNVFYPVIAKNTTAKEVLKSTNEDSPVISTAIEGLIDYNNYKESISANINFEKFLSYLYSDYKDAYLNIVTLNEDKRLTIAGLAVFKDYNMVATLNINDSKTLNLLNNETKNYYLSASCQDNQDKKITINLYSHDTKITTTKKQIKIKANFKANIMDDECEYNFKDSSIYNKLEQNFQDILQNEINATVNYFKNLKTDAIGIQKSYYNQTKQKLDNWYELNSETEVSILIDKNGVIFGVNKQ